MHIAVDGSSCRKKIRAAPLPRDSGAAGLANTLVSRESWLWYVVQAGHFAETYRAVCAMQLSVCCYYLRCYTNKPISWSRTQWHHWSVSYSTYAEWYHGCMWYVYCLRKTELPWHPRLAELFRLLPINEAFTWLGEFATASSKMTPKPIKLWSNNPFINQLRRTLTYLKSSNLKSMYPTVLLIFDIHWPWLGLSQDTETLQIQPRQQPGDTLPWQERSCAVPWK